MGFIKRTVEKVDNVLVGFRGVLSVLRWITHIQEVLKPGGTEFGRHGCFPGREDLNKDASELSAPKSIILAFFMELQLIIIYIIINHSGSYFLH